jgi:DNA-directed RNA polymerase subunit RPC12/RpoP
MKVKFPVGTTIICPNCGRRIATAKRDIYDCEFLDSDPWDSHVGDLREYPLGKCRDCSSPYMMGLMGMVLEVHTDKGWL